MSDTRSNTATAALASDGLKAEITFIGHIAGGSTLQSPRSTADHGWRPIVSLHHLPRRTTVSAAQLIPNFYRINPLPGLNPLVDRWAQRDSNPRHLPCKGSALAN